MSTPLRRVPTVPTTAAGMPAPRRAISARRVVVVFPCVPVTAIIAIDSEGVPWILAASEPRTPRGDPTTRTGTSTSLRSSRPAASVRMATAPAATACGAYVAPCTRAPGRAAYRSPGSTRCELSERPVTWQSWAPVEPRATSSQPATTVSGVADPRVGRDALSASLLTTARGYRDAARFRVFSPLDREASRLLAGRRDGVLAEQVGHHLLEDRAGPGATALATLRVLDHHVDGEARVVRGREATEGDGEGAVIAAALLADPLRGAGLAGHPIAGDRRSLGDPVLGVGHQLHHLGRQIG